MGLHQNNGKELERTEEGRALLKTMRPKNYSMIEWEKEFTKVKVETGAELAEMAKLTSGLVKMNLRLAKTILDDPLCKPDHAFKACALINRSSRELNALIYSVFRMQKELGAEPPAEELPHAPPDFTDKVGE